VASPTATVASTTLPPSSMAASTMATTGKVKLRSKDRGKRNDIRPNSIAFSSYPNFDLAADSSSGSPSKCVTSSTKTFHDDSSEAYLSHKRLRPNGGCSSEPTSERKFRWGRYSEREVYRQITEAMEHHLQSQAYEASRKARSLDDILGGGSSNSSTNSSECQFCSVLSSVSRRCGLPVSLDQYNGCRCGGGTSEPYQSNSSISSGGSHSSLHGSMEIIQVS
jgi:hypothetical protein